MSLSLLGGLTLRGIQLPDASVDVITAMLKKYGIDFIKKEQDKNFPILHFFRQG
jgi:hypothetical protein